MSDFKSLDLHPIILKAIDKQGYTKPTPIQAQAIPHLLKGHDLLGIAQTGTGKTAAFSLPIINHFANKPLRVNKLNARCLILTPTRELASQIQENIETYSYGLNIFSTVIFGGVGKNPQIRAMRRGVDILIATPGRLLDLIGEGHIKFSQLEMFVLDEADRMLDMGFIRDIRKVISLLPKKKQTLLFSATMPKDIESLASSLLNQPKRVEVTPQATTVEKIVQTVNFVEKSNKPHLLKSILKDDDIQSVLVFTRTKHGANKVVKFLEKSGVSSAAIHGNKSQNARQKALADFKAERIRVLVATDIAARGIDIPQVSHVINYELPNIPESYVHRIGRTGRAGRAGIAIAFCEPEERKYLKTIERFINLKVPVDATHEFHGVAGVTPVKRESSEQRSRPSRSSGNSKSQNSQSRRNWGRNRRPKKKTEG